MLNNMGLRINEKRLLFRIGATAREEQHPTLKFRGQATHRENRKVLGVFYFANTGTLRFALISAWGANASVLTLPWNWPGVSMFATTSADTLGVTVCSQGRPSVA